jgi:asparagine synthase (glutamine-hydrolysing)
VWAENGVGFGHRRLSVIDLSEAANQPMLTPDGRHAICFNGEIYNYLDLKRELERAGDTFRTQCDTEALLYALRRWGPDALSRVNGMFAFAFWDREARTLMLARDRIGEKPLAYAVVGGDLVFGSEIKAICAFPGFERRADLAAISHYLAFQYVPAPMTAFAGVKKLPPASYLIARPGAVGEPVTYWRLPPPRARRIGSERDLAAEARDLLRQGVRRRLVADVPVGAFLSGGIDSSMTTALMAQEAGGRIKAFSIGFDEPRYDERAFARLVAQRYGVEHHEEVVREDAASILPTLVWHYGEPFADSSALPTYFLSRLARRHVTVALSGDGGDEFFMGYGRYKTCMDMEWIGGVPRPLRRAAGRIADAMPEGLARRRYFRGARRLLKLASDDPASRYEFTIMSFQDSDKREAYGEALAPYLGASSVRLLDPYFDAAPDLPSGAAWADIHTYLPDDILVKVDIAAMAHGLETRPPFLDPDLMEWAAALPPDVKTRDGALKRILKDAARGLLPDEVIDRPKMGFGVPLDIWFQRQFEGLARDALLSDSARARGLFKPDYVERVLSDHASGRQLHHTRIWTLLMLELWFQTWIDGAPAAIGGDSELLVAAQ